jgi:predicted DNA-binding protein
VNKYHKTMEVQFAPDIEKRLHDLAAQSGCAAAELLQDAVLAYLNETADTQKMLDSRYDDLKSGRVQPIDGEEAFSRLKAKTEIQRQSKA